MPTARKPYLKKKKAGRTLLAHRVAWEEAYGPIPEGYLVHHRNEDQQDNRLSNLELMTPEQHSAHHNDKHPRVKTCAVCGGEFVPAPTKRARAVTCSRPCFQERLSQVQAKRNAHLVDRDERMRALVAQGVKKRDIAEAFGVSPATVTRVTK